MTQKQEVLGLLKTSGERGINSHDLTYVYGIKQAPTRIQELQEEGYIIVSSPPLKNRSVNYILKEKADQVYMWDFSDGVAKRVLVNREPVQEQLI